VSIVSIHIFPVPLLLCLLPTFRFTVKRHYSSAANRRNRFAEYRCYRFDNIVSPLMDAIVTLSFRRPSHPAHPMPLVNEQRAESVAAGFGLCTAMTEAVVSPVTWRTRRSPSAAVYRPRRRARQLTARRFRRPTARRNRRPMPKRNRG